MISAQKMRNIQMLQIGELHENLENKIVDTAIEGNTDYVETPNLHAYQKEFLTEQGFDVEFNDRINEWRISWSK